MLSVFAGATGPGPFSPGTHCWAGATPNNSNTADRDIGVFFLLPCLGLSEITFLFLTLAFALSKIAAALSPALVAVLIVAGGVPAPPLRSGSPVPLGRHTGVPRPRPLPPGPLPPPPGATCPGVASAAAAAGVAAAAAAAVAAAVACCCSRLAFPASLLRWRSFLLGRVVSSPRPAPRPPAGVFDLMLAASSSLLEVASVLECLTAFRL